MKKAIFLILLLAQLYACKKEPIEKVSMAANYIPMKVGSYWIYQIFEQNDGLDFKATNQFDSTFIQKDTMVNGVIYMKMISTFGNGIDNAEPNLIRFLRDSVSYLKSKNIIIFSPIISENEIYKGVECLSEFDTLAIVNGKMKENSSINTPLGVFDTKETVVSHKIYPKHQMYANDIRYYGSRAYAKDIGVVREKLFGYLSAPNRNQEKRLVRYHL